MPYSVKVYSLVECTFFVYKSFTDFKLVSQLSGEDILQMSLFARRAAFFICAAVLFYTGGRAMYDYRFDASYEKFRDSEHLFEIKKHAVEDYYPHFHYATEICCVRKGSFEYAVNGRRGRADTGEIIIFNPGEIHRYFKSKDSEVIIAILSKEYFADFNKDFPEYIFPSVLGDKAINKIIIGLFDKYYDLQKDNFFMENKIFANKICSIICRNYKVIKKNAGEALLIKVLEYIYDNFMNPITPQSVADTFSYSRSQIVKLFQRNVQMDFRAFVNNVRAERVDQMLRDPKYDDWPLVQIVLECGFSGLTTFYRSYKRCFGKLPDGNRHR